MYSLSTNGEKVDGDQSSVWLQLETVNK